jgi:hypothetical protein
MTFVNPIPGLLWTETAYVYRQDERDRTSTGESKGLRAVQGCQGIKCTKKSTPNYDEHSSPAGQSKQSNILTSDHYEFELGYDVRSMDVVKVSFSDGSPDEWVVMAGAAKDRRLLPRQGFYGTTTTAPKIVADYFWGVVASPDH